MHDFFLHAGACWGLEILKYMYAMIYFSFGILDNEFDSFCNLFKFKPTSNCGICEKISAMGNTQLIDVSLFKDVFYQEIMIGMMMNAMLSAA